MAEKTYLLKIDSKLHKRLKLKAVKEETTVRSIILKAVEEYLKKGGK